MVKLFNKISNQLILFLILVLSFFKIFIYILFKFNLISFGLGGGSDANYYHAFALGQIDFATSIWPEILLYLNQINLYSRNVISFLFLILNLIFIPLLLTKISNLEFRCDQKLFLLFFLLISVYPTLFFYSLDIYRDIFMIFIFLLSCLFVKKYILINNFLINMIYLVLIILFGFFLYKLRPYLGYAFFGSFLLWKIKFNKKRIFIFSILYIIILFILNYFELLNSLTEYRSGFDKYENGSTLGLDFSNPIMFIPNFLLSILGQLFGLYIVNPIALILFFLETLPFLLMSLYIVKYIKYADGFIRFLIIFFILYSSVWLIGNDNLGTAVRLRIFNYIIVYICFFYIFRIKNNPYIEEVGRL